MSSGWHPTQCAHQTWYRTSPPLAQRIYACHRSTAQVPYVAERATTTSRPNANQYHSRPFLCVTAQMSKNEVAHWSTPTRLSPPFGSQATTNERICHMETSQTNHPEGGVRVCLALAQNFFSEWRIHPQGAVGLARERYGITQVLYWAKQYGGHSKTQRWCKNTCG